MKFCTCHDSCAVMTCAKFHSDHIITTWANIEWNFRNCTIIVQGPISHDDVIKWKHFPRYWPFVRGIHRSLVNSLNKGQWCGALMLSLIFNWTNGWVNNKDAGDLRRYRAHYDVTVMINDFSILIQIQQLFHSIFAQVVGKWLLQNFAHGKTAVLSWHVQIFVTIQYPIMGLH